MKSGKRSLRILLAMPMALFTVVGLLSYVPALATHAGTTATLAASGREILAGGEQTFSFTINHPNPTGCGGLLQAACPEGIDWVEIWSPAGALPPSQASRQFAVLDGTAPSGWEKRILPAAGNQVPRRIQFNIPQPDPGADPGFNGSATFTVKTTVPVPGADLTRNWLVRVSSNQGTAQVDANGTLQTIVRVLRVPDLDLTAPEKAVTTTKVTEFQDGVEVTCAVENIGDTAIAVTPSLTAPGFSVQSSPAAASIDPGATHVFPPFEITPQDVSSQTNRTLTCNANGTNSEGPSTTTSLNYRQLTIPVQPAAAFDYVKVVRPATFVPRAVGPLANTGFAVQVRKLPNTSPAVDLDGATTQLSFLDDGGNSLLDIPLGSAVEVPANAVNSFLLAFPDVALPGTMTPGVYDAALSIEGEDKNGADVSFPEVPNFNETLTIDAGLPVIEDLAIGTIAKPSNFVDGPASGDDDGYATIEQAQKNNGPAPFSGLVTDNLDSETAERQPCPGAPGGAAPQPGECVLLRASITQYSDFFGTVPIPDSTIEVPGVSINSSGNIVGSYTGAFHADARSIRAQVEVEDAVGQGATSPPTPSVQVDNEIPDILSVRTQRYTDSTGAERQNRLVVTLNECVSLQGTPSSGVLAGRPNNWTASSNTVQSVEGPNCPDGDRTADPDGESTIILTMQDDYADDDDGEFGTLSYAPGCANLCSGQTMQDRVRHVLPNQSNTILDGIAPKTPVIAGVSVADAARGELALQDGEFFTNTNTPVFHVANPAGQENRAVAPGYTIEIWEETNGVAGLQEGDGAGFDTLRGSEKADSDDESECPDPETGLPGETEICSVRVQTDFSPDHPDTGNASLDVYVVAKDTLSPTAGGPNVSLEGQEGLNLDFVRPQLNSMNALADRIEVSFSESVPRGRNFSSDWGAFSADGFPVPVDTVQLGSADNLRDLMISHGNYSPETLGLLQFFYVGPSGGSPDQVAYEDRATNQVLTSGEICTSAGSASDLC